MSDNTNGNDVEALADGLAMLSSPSAVRDEDDGGEEEESSDDTNSSYSSSSDDKQQDTGATLYVLEGA